MLDILQQHLAENATPQLLASVEQAHQLFERMGLENYEPGFQEILMIQGSEVAGTKDSVTDIVELTDALLRQILRDHGITLTAETPLQVLTDVGNALLDLQNFCDLETLRATASLDGTTIEVFCELCHLVTQYTVPELMVYFEEVNWFLPRKIRELADRELTPEQAAQQGERIQRHRQLIQQASQAGVFDGQVDVFNAVRGGMSMGLPFAVYMKSFGAQLAQWPVERSGQELLAMALISRDGCDNPRAMVAEHIEHYIPGLDRVTAIDVDIATRLMKINHEQA